MILSFANKRNAFAFNWQDSAQIHLYLHFGPSGPQADSAGFRIISDNSILIQNMLIQRSILDETEFFK